MKFTRYCILALCVTLAPSACSALIRSQSADTVRLYPGISMAQHTLAKSAMHEFFSQHWERAESLCVQMRALELAGKNVPMSALLRYAMRVWRYLNDEYEEPGEGVRLRHDMDRLRREAIGTLRNGTFPDSTLPTRLFIEGGINGFAATLEINSNPLGALAAGLNAVKNLESALSLAPYMNDAYLGLGLYQCALANAPGVVKVAVMILNGYPISLETGLNYLRTCSSTALYTREGAQQYLIQFLVPGRPEHAAEKEKLFESLQQAFPGNANYVFQELDERLSFHRRGVFSPNTSRWVMLRIERFDTSGFTLRRYANLVKWQCAVIDSATASELRPAALPRSSPFSFYPVFLDAARLRFTADSRYDLTPDERLKELQRVRTLRTKAFELIRDAQIHPVHRDYFEWHMEDGLP